VVLIGQEAGDKGTVSSLVFGDSETPDYLTLLRGGFLIDRAGSAVYPGVKTTRTSRFT
jgi:hypothetical protein